MNATESKLSQLTKALEEIAATAVKEGGLTPGSTLHQQLTSFLPEMQAALDASTQEKLSKLTALAEESERRVAARRAKLEEKKTAPSAPLPPFGDGVHLLDPAALLDAIRGLTEGFAPQNAEFWDDKNLWDD